MSEQDDFETGAGGGQRKRARSYLIVPSSTIDDGDLTLKALGLLNVLLDKPDGWVVRADAIARARKKDGRDSVGSGLRELAERGYYRVERRRLLDGTFKMGNAVSEEPVESWIQEYRENEGRPVTLVQQKDGSFKVKRKDGTLAGDGFEQVTPVTGFPEPAQPDPANPGSGGAGSGKPGPIVTTEVVTTDNKSLPPSEGESRAHAPTDAGAREDNTPGDLIGNAATQTPGAGGRRKAKEIRIPDDWAPSASLLEWAAGEVPGLDVAWETENFILYWRDQVSEKSRKARKSDWDRAWKNSLKAQFVRLGLDRRPKPADPSLFDASPPDPAVIVRADAVADWWLGECSRRGTVLPSVQPKLRELVLAAMTQGNPPATQRQAADALVACGEPCPPEWNYQKALLGINPHGSAFQARQDEARRAHAEESRRVAKQMAEGRTSGTDSLMEMMQAARARSNANNIPGVEGPARKVITGEAL